MIRNHQDGIIAYLLWGWWGGGLIQPTFPLEPQLAGEFMIFIYCLLYLRLFHDHCLHHDSYHQNSWWFSSEFWDQFGGLALGLTAGYVFEIFENSDYVIEQWDNDAKKDDGDFIDQNSISLLRLTRDHGTSQFYKGDSRVRLVGRPTLWSRVFDIWISVLIFEFPFLKF